MSTLLTAGIGLMLLLRAGAASETPAAPAADSTVQDQVRALRAKAGALLAAGRHIWFAYRSDATRSLEGVQVVIPSAYDGGREYQAFVYYNLGGGNYWKVGDKYVPWKTPGAVPHNYLPKVQPASSSRTRLREKAQIQAAEGTVFTGLSEGTTFEVPVIPGCGDGRGGVAMVMDVEVPAGAAVEIPLVVFRTRATDKKGAGAGPGRPDRGRGGVSAHRLRPALPRPAAYGSFHPGGICAPLVAGVDQVLLALRRPADVGRGHRALLPTWLAGGG